MNRLKLIAISVVTTLCALPAWAADPAQLQIERLEAEVSALKARVQKLEQRWEKGVPVNRAIKIEPVPGGWRSTKNWKLLGEGMQYDEVLRILGEPDKTKTIKKFEHWIYGDGRVRLYLNRLKSWEIPSSAK